MASVIKHLALVYRKQVGIGCQFSNDVYMKDVILNLCIGIVSKLKKGEGLNHSKSFYVQIFNAYIMSVFSKKKTVAPPSPSSFWPSWFHCLWYSCIHLNIHWYLLPFINSLFKGYHSLKAKTSSCLKFLG